jgi:hypothetical protein
MVAKSKEGSLDSCVVLPDGRRIVGAHYGQRHVSETKRTFKTLYSPRYKVYANGRGEFISRELRYNGQFVVNRFHGHGEATYDLPHNRIQRYVGEFHNGARCRSGKLYLRDDRSDEYLHFDGSWYNDQPWTGTFFDKLGAGVVHIQEGRRITINVAPCTSTPTAGSSTGSPLHSPRSASAPLSPPVPSAASRPNTEPTVVELNQLNAPSKRSDLRSQRILIITAEETSYSAIKRLHRTKRLAAELRTEDGTLVYGFHEGPRTIAKMSEREFFTPPLWCCSVLQCCRLLCCCCCGKQTVYYLRADGVGEFDNGDDQHRVRFRGRFVDGRTAVLEDFLHRNRVGSSDSQTSSSGYTDPHPADNNDWGAAEDGPPEVDIDEHEVPDSPYTLAEVSITGRVKLVTAARWVHGSKMSGKSILKATIETADGQWVPGSYVGARRKVKSAGKVLRTELVAHGTGYFRSESLHFRYSGEFVDGVMTGLAAAGGTQADGVWTMPTAAV